MSSSVEVAVVIPTRNGGACLAGLLDAIEMQEGRFRPTVVAIDSGSTDGTLDLLRARQARVLTVAPGEFNHGDTRNRALQTVTAQYAVLTVQDALPVSRRWLDALVGPLVADASLAATWARQQPREDASHIAAHYLSHWAGADSKARMAGPLSAEQLSRLTPDARHLACAFDNVCSSVRMSVWRAHPFPAAPFAEDIEWAREVMVAGHRIAFVPDAVVRHSHDRSVSYELRRTYLAHQRLHALFGLTTIPTAGALLRSVSSSLALHVRLAAAERAGRGRALARGVGLAVALPLGQYLGARADREGRELLKVRDV